MPGLTGHPHADRRPSVRPRVTGPPIRSGVTTSFKKSDRNDITLRNNCYIAVVVNIITPMKTLHQTKMAYISPNSEVYRGEYDGVLCVSYTVEIINGGVITEDEDPWEPKQ